MTQLNARSVGLVTSDDSVRLPEPDSVPFFVERHPWRDDEGALDPQAIVDLVAMSEPLALCIAQDVPEELALDICRRLDSLLPEVGIILLRPADGELWSEAARAGVREIIAPYSPSSEILGALEVALERGERIRQSAPLPPDPSAPKGKVIVVLSPKGGSGKTMLASNLAVALAVTNTGEAALVDLDCVFGDVASVLGLVPEHNVAQLASLPSFDSTTLKVFLTRHEQSGLHILAGSGSPEEGELVTDKLSAQVLEMLTRDFAYVVVDTAAGLDERALAAIDQATDIVLLASLDVTSIRNLAKEINTLDRLGVHGPARHFVLNRADARVGLEIADVEAAIGMKVDIALPSSRLVPLSMNQGTLVVVQEPESPVAQQILLLARSFAPKSAFANQQSSEPKGRFSLRRSK